MIKHKSNSMKSINILIVIIFALLFCSCEKEKQSDFTYDCFVKSTYYLPSGEILQWNISYYQDDRNVKQENSNGDFCQTDYDNYGHLIRVISNDSKTEYDYNSDNRVINTRYYSNGQLDYYTVANYMDSLVKTSYSIDYKNDTIGWSEYFYNSGNKLDSVISDSYNEYYYYSSAIDSIITKSKSNSVISVNYLKYSNGKKTYYEGKFFNFLGIMHDHFIKTWEYNEDDLLIRETIDRLLHSGERQWVDQRRTYNDLNELVKSEAFDEMGALIVYTNYIYENSVLTKTQSFNNQNVLTGYSIIENNCKK